ncbi:MAG: hypothetical protein LBQ15_00170 [Clostridium sp.]|jgi:hypothetical protein|nr:hypothetical protein [Clostridium sp.]
MKYEEDKFERRSLSNTELMSAKADREDKFERRSLSNTELMSAKADREDKYGYSIFRKPK